MMGNYTSKTLGFYAILAVLLSMLLCACQSEPSNYAALKTAVDSNSLEGVKEAAATASRKDITQAYHYSGSIDSWCINPAISTYLVEIGVDVNQFDPDGYAPLMFSKQIETCEWFLQHGADINLRDKKGNSAIDYAAGDGHVDDVLLYLISQGGEVTAHTLEAALERKRSYGSIQIVVKQLLKQGEQTGLPPIVEAAITGDSETVLALIEKEELTEEDLNWVSENVVAFGSAEALAACVQKGFYPFEFGRGIYSDDIAIEYGNMETLQWLQAYLQENEEFKGGITPLNAAVSCDRREMAEYLLEIGYRFQDPYEGFGLLFDAARNGNMDWIEFLLQNGYSQKEDVLRGAAYQAATNGHPEALEYLFEYFAANPEATEILQRVVHENRALSVMSTRLSLRKSTALT